MGEGRLEPSLTTDGGPYAAGGWNEGCHGVAWRAPADGRCLGIGGSRGNAPNPDRGRPTQPALKLTSQNAESPQRPQPRTHTPLTSADALTANGQASSHPTPPRVGYETALGKARSKHNTPTCIGSACTARYYMHPCPSVFSAPVLSRLFMLCASTGRPVALRIETPIAALRRGALLHAPLCAPSANRSPPRTPRRACLPPCPLCSLRRLGLSGSPCCLFRFRCLGPPRPPRHPAPLPPISRTCALVPLQILLRRHETHTCPQSVARRTMIRDTHYRLH